MNPFQQMTTAERRIVQSNLRGRHITFSGYMACGKSTAVVAIARRLEGCGVAVKVRRFRPLYPSFHFPTLRGGRRGRPSSGRGGHTNVSSKVRPSSVAWNKRFTFFHFVNTVPPLLFVYSVRLFNRKSVTIFDRYFYDYYVHYRRSGFWYCLARWLTPRPDMAFLLQTVIEDLTQRTNERLSELTGDDGQLDEKECDALRSAQTYYAGLRQEWPRLVTVTMNAESDFEYVWRHVVSLLGEESIAVAGESEHASTDCCSSRPVATRPS